MKIKIAIYARALVVTVLVLLIVEIYSSEMGFSGTSFAATGWETSVTVSSGAAENRLFLGQKPGATLVPWFGYWIYLGKDDVTYKLIITKP